MGKDYCIVKWRPGLILFLFTVLVHHIHVDVILTTERNDWCLTLTFFLQFADLERYIFYLLGLYYKLIYHPASITLLSLLFIALYNGPEIFVLICQNQLIS
jgi:hypothetical protein